MTESIKETTTRRRKRIRLPLDAYLKPEAWYFLTICCRKNAPLLETGAVRDLVRDVLCRTASNNRVELAAYTILPNHIHLVCSAGRKGVIGFVQEFKSKTAVELKRLLGMTSPWQGNFFDHKIRSQESLRAKCEYVWMNPVRRGLVAKPEDYPWSGSLRTG